MYACDFRYDGKLLSEYGFVVCEIDGDNGVDRVEVGADITFNKVSRFSGKKHSLTSTEFGDCLTTTFDICYLPDGVNPTVIDSVTYRTIAAWLNRRDFHRFELINDQGIYYNASFTLNKILCDDMLYGIELTLETDSPFAYREKVEKQFEVTDSSEQTITIKAYEDLGDIGGYIYPSMTITCNEAGNLVVKSSTNDSEMRINNVSAGEVITVDGDTLEVSTSLDSHKLYDDFNFDFFRLSQHSMEAENKFTVTPKSTVVISYTPMVKDSPT